MKIHVQKPIKARTEVLWKYLADFSNIDTFHPFLRRSNEISNHESAGRGMERACYLRDGSFLKEKVVDWREGTYYTVEMTETSLPMTRAKTTIGISQIDCETSLGYMLIDLKPKNWLVRPFLFFLFQFVLGPLLLRGLAQVSLPERRAMAAFYGVTL